MLTPPLKGTPLDDLIYLGLTLLVFALLALLVKGSERL